MYYGKAIRPTCQPFRAYFYNWIAFLVENQHVPAMKKKADFFSQPPAVIIGEAIFGRIFQNFALRMVAVIFGSILYNLLLQNKNNLKFFFLTWL